MSKRGVRPPVEQRPPAEESDRRVAQRYGASEVPWIVAVKPAVGAVAQLVNISNTGVLLDSRDRLAPGRRTTLFTSTADDRVLRLPVVVVRTHVVALNPDGTPLYRTALTFESELECDLETGQAGKTAEAVNGEPAGIGLGDPGADATEMAVAPDAAAPSVPVELTLDGPLDGGLSSTRGTEAVSISGLTETGCTVRMHSGGTIQPGESVIVTLLFSSYRMTINGEVGAPAGERFCAVRFNELSATERRLLRGEIRGYATRRAPRTQAEPLARTGTDGPAAPRFVLQPGASVLVVGGNAW